MIISDIRWSALACVLLIIPVTTSIPWQNTHALAKILMNRNFMLNNPKEFPRLESAEKNGNKKPVTEKTTPEDPQKTEIGLESKKEDSTDVNKETRPFATPLASENDKDSGKTIVPGFLPKIEIEPPAILAKEEEIADEGLADKVAPSSIDTLVYGHAPETETRNFNSAISVDVDGVVNQGVNQEYEEDYYYSDGEYDQVADEAGKSEVQVEVADSEAEIPVDAPPKQIKPSEIFSVDEGTDIEEEETETREDKEVKTEEGIDEKKKFFYDIPYGLFSPAYPPLPYVFVPHYPWLTMSEILWRLEVSLLGLEQATKTKELKIKEEKLDINEEKLDINEEVVELDGKKFLLKTFKTKYDPSETEHSYISMASLTPMKGQVEEGKKKSFPDLTKEIKEQQQVEIDATS